MSLYALGDLHLCFGRPSPFPMEDMGQVWVNREKHFRENCAALMGDTDTLVLAGDHSWGRNLTECQPDFEYIRQLPGRKILIRGNHDMFWDSGKTERLNEIFQGKLYFLQNNFYAYGDYALVGSKGYCYEGKDSIEHAEKLVNRELDRLRISFDAACQAGYRKFIMFLHYPPTNILQRSSGFTKMAEKYHAEQVVYAHCHGEQRFHDSIRGKKRGIRYSLVSGDCLRFRPLKILD